MSSYKVRRKALVNYVHMIIFVEKYFFLEMYKLCFSAYISELKYRDY